MLGHYGGKPCGGKSWSEKYSGSSTDCSELGDQLLFLSIVPFGQVDWIPIPSYKQQQQSIHRGLASTLTRVSFRSKTTFKECCFVLYFGKGELEIYIMILPQ